MSSQGIFGEGSSVTDKVWVWCAVNLKSELDLQWSVLWSTCESDVLSLSSVRAGGWSACVTHLISCSSLNCCEHSSTPQLLTHELADSRAPVLWRQHGKTNRKKRKSRAFGTAVGTGWISANTVVMTGLLLGTSHCSCFPKPVLCPSPDFIFVHHSPIHWALTVLWCTASLDYEHRTEQ